MKGTVGTCICLLALSGCESKLEAPSTQNPRAPLGIASEAPIESAPRSKGAPSQRVLRSSPGSTEIVVEPSRPASPLQTPTPAVPEEGHMILIEESDGPNTHHSDRTTNVRGANRTGVRAGSADDNLQFGAFLRFLSENVHLGKLVDVRGRIIVEVTDKDGLPLANAKLEVKDRDRVLVERLTYADGRALLFPAELPTAPGRHLILRASFDGAHLERELDPKSARLITLRINTARPLLRHVPLDVVFVMDATGSMQDELDDLRDSLQQVIEQISHFSPTPDLRLGMVLYRDKDHGAEATELIPLTRNFSAFQFALEGVRASGGDDYAEDVQGGLQQALTAIKWNQQGIRLGFLIGDAPPHLDGYQPYGYDKAMKDAARRGIKLATIGASGLNRQGELVWRQIAQYTMSPFVFLTYGEGGDAEGGRRSVSHHVGSNWAAERLDAVIVRMIKSELQSCGPRGAPVREDFFEANYQPGVPVVPVFEELFEASVQQLVDYAVDRIGRRTPTAMLPFQNRDGSPKALARSLEHRLGVALSRHESFRLVEVDADPRLEALVKEQFRERFDESARPSLGKQIPAKLAVVSELGHGRESSYELLIKLIRLETNEVLSVSLLRIDPRLGGGMMTAQRD